MDLHPFNFLEFLDAVEKTQLKKYLENKSDWTRLESAFHDELSDQLRLYMFIGGMPEVITTYTKSKDYKKIRLAQSQILKSYALDFAKYPEKTESVRISQIWDSIASQLARENKKFKYSDVKKGGRAAEFEVALRWLKDAGLILPVFCLSTIKLPLKAYKEETKFKIYLFDTGLLGAMLNVPMKSIVEKNELFTQFNGAFTENYVAQQLTAAGYEDLYYWAMPQRAEVDFIVDVDNQILPLEVKAENSKPKDRMKLYRDKFQPPIVCTTSPTNFSSGGNTCNLPLYAIPTLTRLSSVLPFE